MVQSLPRRPARRAPLPLLRHDAGAMVSICYPTCGDWACEQAADWQWIDPDDPVFPAVKREWKIRWKCTPRQKWPTVLRETRRKRNGGLPLWVTR